MPSLFISYRRSDSPDTVKLIHERLKRRLPRWEIFYDHESIPLGDQFPERLRAKVGSATVVLVIIGPRWLEILQERRRAAVDHVRAEVRLALELARSVVPILVGHARMPTEAELTGFAGLQPLLQRNGRPVRPDPDFDADLEPIIAHLRQIDSDETIGATLADKSTLTAEVGHGGMGVVYRAEQKQPVKRTVAVKLIKPGMDSRDVLARFEAERQALAVMDHPNIAKVHDAGMTANGRPFFVMEYVKGVPITEYCDDKKLTPQERLNLFIPVCNAVQHAHQKGIIHRDIKPSNVLVEAIDGKPVPKVIDFGLAKALGQKLTEKTLYTDMNMRVGTLEYSAPEQAAGRSFDVDTRSDIYSLGILLYELLTGAPPFTHAELLKIGEKEMCRVISEDEPTKPSKKLSSSGELPVIAANRHLEPNKLTRLVQGDLDWIVMKCLEKEQARRYETANQLGQELQRFLADEPVQAGPPSAVYRLRKFVRRHKAGLLTTAALLLAALLAASGIGWALWDHAAQESARRVELAGRMTETEKAVTVALTKAQQSEEKAKRLPCKTNVEAKAVLAEWREATASLTEAEAALRTGAAADDLRERVVEVRQRIASGRMQAQRKEKLFRDLDDARMVMATWKESHFDYAGAAAKYAAAFAEFGLEVQPGQAKVLAQRIRSEEPAVRDALIVALDNWAFCAEPMMKTDLVEIAQAADEDAWRRDYRQAEGKQDFTALMRLSKEAHRLTLPPVNLDLLAVALHKNDQREEARELLRWARGLHPTDFWIALRLGMYLGEPKAAIPVELEERIGCFRVAVALRPDASLSHLNLGAALHTKNQALPNKNQLDEAIAEFKKAIALDPKVAMAHKSLGLALHRKNRLDEAIAEYNKTIALDPKDAETHCGLGLALHAKNQLDEAIAEFKKAIALDPKDAMAHKSLGRVLYAKNRLEEAIAEFNKAIALNPKFAPTHFELGIALYDKNQLDEAIAEFNKAIALDPKDAEAHWGLGIALMAKNQLDDAIAEYKKAIALDPKDAPAHYTLGEALLRQSRFAQAESSFQRCLELRSASDPRREATEERMKQARRFLELDKKLPSILSGESKPTDTGTYFDLVELCQIKQLNAAGARFSKLALTEKPALADDLNKVYRYNAACFAASAAAGQGKDADKLTSQERADLRKQALQWLRSDLAAWGKQLDKATDKARPVVQGKMTHWKQDTDLTGVRDPKALEKLPPDERDAWQKLWKDVDALLAKTREKK